MQFPKIDPSTLPSGLLAPGPDKSIYMAHDNKWILYRKAVVINIKCDDQYVSMIDYPDINEKEIPEILPTEKMASVVVDTCIIEPIKKRGRPKGVDCKNKNRCGREPTAYNRFFKEKMSELKHITDARLKMTMVAHAWREQKLSYNQE